MDTDRAAASLQVFFIGIGLIAIAAHQITAGKLELAAFTGTGG